MSRRKSRKEPAKSAASEPKNSLRASGWEPDVGSIRRQPFPGPTHVNELMRVHFHTDAYAELIAHAKESLDREVCGVLVGAFAEDEEGSYVAVDAIIRGSQAEEGGAHVTYTQETWNHIHSVKDRDYPNLAIVGWYHTHPGFGVEFSDMDIFIQDNFFSTSGQLAYLIDPLGGEEAICVNTEGGLSHLRRFWVNGRERRCYVPARPEAMGDPSLGHAAIPPSELKAVEERLTQVIREFESQRNFLHGVVGSLAVVVAAFFLYFIVANIMDRRKVEMPKLRQEVPVVVRIGDKNVLLGVGVYAWDVPPELDTLYQKLAEATAQEEARRQAQGEEHPAESQGKGLLQRAWDSSWRLWVGSVGLLALGAGGIYYVRRRRRGVGPMKGRS